jgi:hypothetical protein
MMNKSDSIVTVRGNKRTMRRLFCSFAGRFIVLPVRIIIVFVTTHEVHELLLRPRTVAQRAAASTQAAAVATAAAQPAGERWETPRWVTAAASATSPPSKDPFP